MAAKVGDIVRFLNSKGGGRITRIDGQIAYVDEDGFETPVLVRECVVVAQGDTFYKTEARQQASTSSSHRDAEPAKNPPLHDNKTKEEILPPVVETPQGEKINLVLGFEPQNIKKLSETSFDAFLVNDSNYSMYISIATRNNESDTWMLRFAGYIEPSIQEFVFELTTTDLPDIDYIAIQAIPFKRTKEYNFKPVISLEKNVDSTKFARLHSFIKNPYFENDVLCIEIVKDDIVQHPLHVKEELKKAYERRNVEPKESPAQKKISKPAHRPAAQPIEIDLHAGALLDNLNGLSKADILNYQIDTFRRVMDENQRFPGRKIVFIHGKGEGILRQAIMKELNHRYKGHDVADASFREYGFGATQVTIRKQQKINNIKA